MPPNDQIPQSGATTPKGTSADQRSVQTPFGPGGSWVTAGDAEKEAAIREARARFSAKKGK